ncbi:hypothetical protein AHMF7605_27390 [Adhaeribacter arboris]|uniref:HTH araC/xylS-type domain-containing protein n=1 Tax=Adhaeribacter arboris TaxID=2072846 RepID=A0A2T2YN66_9BACT|nr:AraC family transcriptional regulator [Adhaeribacter arboris]PSR56953.1 hypothetical protein AHMF7605_27390 [Adhaeribacter arboris]
MEKLYTDWTLKNIIGHHGLSEMKMAPLNARYQEYCFLFNEPGVVQGCFKTFSSPNVEVSLMEMHLEKSLVFLAQDGVERLSSTLLLRGSIGSDSFYDSQHRAIEHSPHMFVYSWNYQNKFTLHPGKLSLININLKPEFFFKVTENEADLTRLLKGKQPEDFCLAFPLSFSRHSEYQKISHAISANSFKGITQHLFIEAKAYELFSLELEELLQVRKIPARSGEINSIDKEKLLAAHDFILHHFAEPLSLDQIATQFQINAFKLKKGYKILFNHTVFGHIQALRMNQAKELLITQQYNVAEAAYQVGYSSPNNFSTAFSKMFGYPPSKITEKKSW